MTPVPSTLATCFVLASAHLAQPPGDRYQGPLPAVLARVPLVVTQGRAWVFVVSDGVRRIETLESLS